MKSSVLRPRLLSAIVEEAGRHPGRLTGGAPRRAAAADGDAVAVEDERAVRVAACPPSREGLGDGERDRENPPHPGLRAREQFLLVDDVVEVEDGAVLVAGQEHGDRDRR